MFVESAFCHGGLVDFKRVIFHLPWIFKFPLPEVWRFITPFLITGGGFSFVFDLYFSTSKLSYLTYLSLLTCIQCGHTVPGLSSTPLGSASLEIFLLMLFL